MPTKNRLDLAGLTFYHNDTLPVGENLLHNADWGYSLINQRDFGGQGTDEYCIDRWKIIGTGTVIPSRGAGSYVGVSSNTTLEQLMEIIPSILLNQPVTFAYQTTQDDIYTVPLTFPSTLPESSGQRTNVTAICEDVTVEIGFQEGSYGLCNTSQNAVPYIRITTGDTISFRRVWLELGRVCHMEKTPPNDYALNLYICGRYFYGFPKQTWGHFSLGFGSVTSGITTFTTYLPLINRMRSRLPTVSMYGSTTPHLYLDQTYELSNLSAVRVDSTSAYCVFSVSSPSSITVGRLYDLCARETAPTLCFSADL